MTNKTQTTPAVDETTEVKLPHQVVLETINVDLEDAVNQGFRLQVHKCEKNYKEAFEKEDEEKKEKWWKKSKELANGILEWKKEVDAAAIVNENYDTAVKNGDILFEQGDFEGAATNYRTALQHKPKETYPQSQLAEIDKRLGDAKTAEENQTKYNDFIAFADGKLATFEKLNMAPINQLEEAREAYQKASDIFPDEQHPIDQITLIDKALKKAAEKQDFEPTVEEGGKPKELTAEQKERIKAKVQSIVKDINDIHAQNGKVTHENLTDILPDPDYDTTKAELRIGDPEKHGATVVLVKESDGVYKIKQDTAPAKKGLSTGAKVGIFAGIAIAIGAGIWWLTGRKPKQ